MKISAWSCASRWIALAVAFCSPAIASAQASFPDRPLRLIVTFPAGGSTDVVARLMAARMSESLGRTVIVDNRAGAAGLVGTAELAKAQPDGYTLLFHIVTTAAINPHLHKNVSFDWVKDFQPVALIAHVPNVLMVNKEAPARNVKELVAWVKANPGKLNYGSSGTGGLMHLSGELLKQQAGIDIQHVPYKGSAPAMQELIGGSIVMMFDNITGPIGQIKAGQVRALGVTTAERVSVLSDVPTLAESGLPEFKNSSWFSLFTRAGVPPAVLARLETEALRAVNHPDTLARLRELGAVPAPMGAAPLDKYWKSEIDYWGRIVQSANIKLE